MAEMGHAKPLSMRLSDAYIVMWNFVTQPMKRGKDSFSENELLLHPNFPTSLHWCTYEIYHIEVIVNWAGWLN